MLDLPAGAKWIEGSNKFTRAVEFGPKTSIDLPGAGDVEADQAFSFGGWIFVPKVEGKYAIASRLDPKSKKTAGWILELDDRTLSFRMIGDKVIGDKAAKDELQIRANASLRLQGGKWAHVFVTYDGSRKLDGLALYVDGKPQYTEQPDSTSLQGSIRNHGAMRIGSDGKRDFHGGAVEDFRFYRRELRAEEVTVASKWAELHNVLAKDDAAFTAAQRQDLLLLYLNRFNVPYQQVMTDLEEAEEERAAHPPAQPDHAGDGREA